MSIAIRRLTPADGAAYRALRLEALKAHPEAYGSSYEEQKDKDVSFFAERLGKADFFGAFDGDALIGSAGLDRDKAVKSAHVATLIGVYVRPSHRGTGAAEELLKAVITHGQDLVEQIYLGVGTQNLGALRLYQRLGFEIYGTQPASLKVGGAYIDEYLMVRFLKGTAKGQDR